MKKDQTKGRDQFFQDREPSFRRKRLFGFGYDSNDVDNYIQELRMSVVNQVTAADEKIQELSAEVERAKSSSQSKEEGDNRLAEEIRLLQEERKSLQDEVHRQFESLQEKERNLALALAELREFRQAVHERAQKEAQDYIEEKRTEVGKEILRCYEELAKITEERDQINRDIQVQREQATYVLQAFRQSLTDLMSVAQRTLQSIDTESESDEVSVESDPSEKMRTNLVYPFPSSGF